MMIESEVECSLKSFVLNVSERYIIYEYIVGVGGLFQNKTKIWKMTGYSIVCTLNLIKCFSIIPFSQV